MEELKRQFAGPSGYGQAFVADGLESARKRVSLPTFSSFFLSFFFGLGWGGVGVGYGGWGGVLIIMINFRSQFMTLLRINTTYNKCMAHKKINWNLVS